ncbi:hypothetical protein [Allobaculum mucilyticum]|uniref:hypothetical protein n=1 Tax=Allobaculum mucilyticum TaxID=2834459 RepID=UPI001E59237C|nr:hypothetical protein [Allobaculum mucilyticum]UNT95804.1 hypothetical protein KWG62_10930 [Allobaculum mucilyticum]
MTELDKKLHAYRDAFGEDYVFQFGFLKTEEEIIAEIEACLCSEKKQKLEKYDSRKDY